MDLVGIVAVALIFGFIPLLAFVFALSLIVTGRWRSRQGRMHEAEEARWIQQMHDGMVKLGQRVEALETLLMDQPTPNRDREGAGRVGGNK